MNIILKNWIRSLAWGGLHILDIPFLLGLAKIADKVLSDVTLSDAHLSYILMLFTSKLSFKWQVHHVRSWFWIQNWEFGKMSSWFWLRWWVMGFWLGPRWCETKCYHLKNQNGYKWFQKACAILSTIILAPRCMWV